MNFEAVPGCTIEQVCFLRITFRIEICFHRCKALYRCVGKLTQNGLAADDNEFVVVGYFAAGANNVLKLLTHHRSGLARTHRHLTRWITPGAPLSAHFRALATS